MAKFCGNCGAQLDDDDKVCGQCGTPVNGNAGTVPGLKVVDPETLQAPGGDDPEKKKKMAKRIKWIVALVIVVALAITVVKVYLSFTGTNGLVRKVMTAYEDYDVDSLVALSSDMYYYFDSDDYVDEYFEDAVGKYIDNFESSVGHSYKLTYEVDEIYDLSKRKQEEIFKSIGNQFPDFDVDTISKIAVANVKVTAKQGSKSVNKTVKITMSKEGKEWKLLYLE